MEGCLMDWQMNQAGDWEVIVNGNRYVAEQLSPLTKTNGPFCLTERCIDFDVDPAELGSFQTLKQCEEKLQEIGHTEIE